MKIAIINYFKYSYLPLIFILVFMSYGNTQTTESGPWWPHPIWGEGDQAGASNWITSEKILNSLKLVKTGKVYELGQVYEKGMPLYGSRSYEMRSPGSPTGGPLGDNNVIYNDEFLCTEIGQVGTQFDGPGHIGTRLQFTDGSVRDVYYNGFTGKEMYSPYGLLQLGVEHIKPIITKGILVDIAGARGVEVLPNNYEVTVADVKNALKRQGLSEDDIQDGDAIFFRLGWSKWWSEPEKYNSNQPGIGAEVANWVVSKNASMTGFDQSGAEPGVPSTPEIAIIAHQILVNQNGIFNLENLHFDELVRDEVYQFLFIFTPVRFKGATGSPGRPIAIR